MRLFAVDAGVEHNTRPDRRAMLKNVGDVCSFSKIVLKSWSCG